jgi:NitT/TauT family transport system permease protein
MSLLDAPYRYTSLQKTLLSLVGVVLFLLLWWAVAEAFSDQRPLNYENSLMPSSLDPHPDSIALRADLLRKDSISFADATEFEKIYPVLPPPLEVAAAFPGLISPSGERKSLIHHAGVSIWRNTKGYFWAIFFSLLIGIPIAVSPLAKALFSKQIDTLRYVPLTALSPLFLLAFTPDEAESYKVSFLAVGILVYLLPVVMQRLWETEDVYLKTAYTLGASDWQLVKSVYVPAVLSKLIDDIRVLTAISWTYIIIAEVEYRTDGLGSMSYILDRQGNNTGVFAVLITIVLIGFTQDRLFAYMNTRLFPHRSVKAVSSGLRETRNGFLTILGAIMLYLLITAITGPVFILGFILAIVCAAATLLIIYGEFALQKSTKTA